MNKNWVRRFEVENKTQLPDYQEWGLSGSLYGLETCVICKTPIPSYTCPGYKDINERKYTPFSNKPRFTCGEIDTCFYHKTSFIEHISCEVMEHFISWGTCSFYYKYDYLCRSKRCKDIFKWSQKKRFRIPHGKFYYFHVVVKYLEYLIKLERRNKNDRTGNGQNISRS